LHSETNLRANGSSYRAIKLRLMENLPMKRIITLTLLAGMALSTAACGCRPGHVGPYGGVHPGGCWVG
jgi:hypothetical protein